MRVLLTAIALFLFGLPAIAQSPQAKMQRLEEIKRKFITQKLDLTADESERFWPVYANYQRDLAALNRERRQARVNGKEDPGSVLNDELGIETQLLEIRKKYRREFSRVIPDKKIVKLYQAERDFRGHVLNELRKRGR